MSSTPPRKGSPPRTSNGRAQRASALLGTDAPLARDRPRRVPSRTTLGEKNSLGAGAPLLNCTAESRRQAADGQQAARRFKRRASAPRPSSGPMVLSLATAGALGVAVAKGLVRCGSWPPRAVGWGFIAFLFMHAWLLPTYLPFLFKAPQPVVEEEPTSPSKKLLACWGGSLERVPPQPIQELPETLEELEEPWMAEAKLPSRWSISERRFLKRCRETFAEQFAAVTPYADVYGDRRLLRVLRMDPLRDEDAAVKKVGDYLTWRRETNADDLRARVPADGPDPNKWPHGDVLYQCLRILQCSDRYFDREGNAVTVYQAFHWPAPQLRKHLRQLSTVELVTFSQMAAEYNGSQQEKISRAREAVVLQSVKRKFEERKRNGLAVDDPPLLDEGWGELTRLCAITDMRGCTFGSVMMPTLIPAVVQAVQMFLNYYPFIVGKLHIVNCQPMIASIFRRALVSVIPAHVAKQITIHGLDSRDIFQSVAADHLPRQLGGEAECPELEPPPPPPAGY
jgi:hypothetical protein